VAWNVDTLDWRYPDVERITRVAVSEAVNGSIILMHDIHPRTIDAAAGIIDGLRARGFRLVTVSDLLGGSCGGQESGYGVQVPGETPRDPFGVDKFQGQQVAASAATQPRSTAAPIAKAVTSKSAAKPTAQAELPVTPVTPRAATYCVFCNED
jgi:hypothetical protein